MCINNFKPNKQHVLGYYLQLGIQTMTGDVWPANNNIKQMKTKLLGYALPPGHINDKLFIQSLLVYPLPPLFSVLFCPYWLF